MVWCLPLLQIIPSILLGRTVAFRLTYFRCEGFFLNRFAKIIPPLTALCAVVLPMLIVTVCIVRLLFYLAKVRGLQKQAVVTLLLVNTCYFTSFLSYCTYYVLGGFLGWRSNFNLAVYFYRFGLFVMYTNFAVNPILYYTSIRSFRRFVHFSAGSFLLWVRGCRILDPMTWSNWSHTHSNSDVRNTPVDRRLYHQNS